MAGNTIVSGDAGFSGSSQGGLGSSQSGRTASGVGKIIVRLDDPEIRGIIRAFGRMEKGANEDLRKLSRAISDEVAGELRNSARNHRWYPRQAGIVAQSIRVNRDRIPSISIGGSKRFTASDGRRVAYGSLLFGNEFGSQPSIQQQRFRNRAQAKAGARGGYQFPPRSPREGRGSRGYWIFPRLKRIQPRILAEWLEGAQKVADAWGKR